MASAEDEPAMDIEEISFEDSESYVQRRRQKEILDVTREALETRRAAREEFARGEIDISTCREIVRIAVEDLIAETEPVIRRSGSQELWQSAQLGDPVTIYPPADAAERLKGDNVRLIGDTDLQPKTVANIRGLSGYRTAPAVFSATWDIHAIFPHQGPQKKTLQNQIGMPLSVSESAIYKIKQFLSQTGLGVEAKLEPYTGDGGPGL